MPESSPGGARDDVVATPMDLLVVERPGAAADRSPEPAACEPGDTWSAVVSDAESQTAHTERAGGHAAAILLERGLAHVEAALSTCMPSLIRALLAQAEVEAGRKNASAQLDALCRALDLASSAAVDLAEARRLFDAGVGDLEEAGELGSEVARVQLASILRTYPFGPPDCRRVVVPPPKKLAKLHFNDWTLAYMSGESAPAKAG